MEEKLRQELADRCTEAVQFLEREVRSYDLDSWQAMEVTMSQAKTLALLRNLGPLRMGAIATQLGSGLSATTALVDRLVEKDLVRRSSDPADRRVVVCELTDSGRESIERAMCSDPIRLQEALALLEGEQLEVVATGLELLLTAARQLREGGASS
ncbi:MAG: MarR family transcriptional regulator [Dehalococcoidia bacterium]|nr:MarR family transcriptional regulator [Dehalococcoidia bacterium]MYA53654.1 MarR family transcriptional regulator [Dehalococcoidia bacterium]